MKNFESAISCLAGNIIDAKAGNFLEILLPEVAMNLVPPAEHRAFNPQFG
jgi:hypothetical protein